MFASRTAWDLTPNRLSLALAEHKRSGRYLFDLTISNPTTCGLEYPAEAVLKSLATQSALTYQPEAQGLLVARQAVADYYSAKSLDVPPQNILLTTSTSEGYSFIFRLLCEPADEVLIPRPSYPLFEFLADIQDVHLVPYPLVYDHGWLIDLPSLTSRVTARTRAIIVVNPNNPTGSFVSRGELKELNSLCAAHDLALISDEVFHDFPFREEDCPCLASNQESLTFTLSGISKIAGLPQMKAAWIVAGGPADRRMPALARLEVIADTYLSMNAPIQHALPTLLASREGFQNQLNARLKSNLRQLDEQIAAQRNCTRLEVQGGWHAIVRVPATQSDEDLAIHLLEQRDVYTHPGHFFDFEQEGYLVLSLMTPESDFAEGTTRILDHFSH